MTQFLVRAPGEAVLIAGLATVQVVSQDERGVHLAITTAGDIPIVRPEEVRRLQEKRRGASVVH